MVNFPITSQSIKDTAVEASLLLCTFEKSSIEKILAAILDQLNLHSIKASNVQAWTTDAYQRKMTETKLTFSSKIVLIKVHLSTWAE